MSVIFKRITFIALAGFCLSLATACNSRSNSDLEQQVTSLQFEVEKLKNKLSSLKSHPTPAPTTSTDAHSPIVGISPPNFSAAKEDPFLGSDKAEVQLSLFTSYPCKLCRRFAKEVMPKIRTEFIDPGYVRLTLRDFPLTSQQFGESAARFAHCAGEQGRYWQAHDLLFRETDHVDEGQWPQLRKLLPELDEKRFLSCFERAERYRTEIGGDIEEGQRVGVKGVPAIVLTKTDGSKAVLIRGAQPYPVIRAEINKLLPQKDS